MHRIIHNHNRAEDNTREQHQCNNGHCAASAGLSTVRGCGVSEFGDQGSPLPSLLLSLLLSHRTAVCAKFVGRLWVCSCRHRTGRCRSKLEQLAQVQRRVGRLFRLTSFSFQRTLFPCCFRPFATNSPPMRPSDCRSTCPCHRQANIVRMSAHQSFNSRSSLSFLQQETAHLILPLRFNDRGKRCKRKQD